ncbi:bZIP transcription factor 46 [Diospyros lotus]|uniref:bZIP transcription factor 46 n=1 Tax=Diospyros lotus TaxID=55363 RepID=UPI00225B0D38|nr:bZIP transcription factor 46 [Diospyros lotus]
MMGSHVNFKNFGDTPQSEFSGMKPAGNMPLLRQPSLYSLTFDEFQNTLGGFGKDFGSMNMDELLKNIWTAEETQAKGVSSGGGGGSMPGGNLQRQGSLTLPRTLSQKTVDEVWRDLFKESSGARDGAGNGGVHFQQRQPTLGEMTLEEFLARAGVVKEDPQPIGRANNGAFFGELSQPSNNNSGLAIGFQQSARNNEVLANEIRKNNKSVVNISGTGSSQQQLQQQQHQPLFPKQTTLAFGTPMPLVNNTQLASPGIRMPNPSVNNPSIQGTVIQNGSLGMTGIVTGTTMVASGSPASKLSSDAIANSNVDTSSLSPSPYMFSEGVRGRKCGGTLEKAMERRHRRMIKNRESAARSRARKQAYTLELEAEVAKLKEINQELRKKQEKIMERQKNQIVETMILPWGSKRQCLRRTLTGPW